MPAHERVRSPLRHPPYRRRSRRRRGKAPYRGRGPQRAAILTWLLTSVTLITVAVILSNGGPAACPMHLESAAVSPGAKVRGLGGHQASGSGLAAIRYDPQDTQPSDIDLWQREIIVRGRAGKPGRPLSPRRAG